MAVGLSSVLLLLLFSAELLSSSTLLIHHHHADNHPYSPMTCRLASPTVYMCICALLDIYP